MYEMESIDGKSVATYAEKILETLEDEAHIRITELEEEGKKYGVNSLYDGAEEKDLEFRSEEISSIGNYLEDRIEFDSGGLDLEISSDDEKYTVSNILEG